MVIITVGSISKQFRFLKINAMYHIYFPRFHKITNREGELWRQNDLGIKRYPNADA